MRIWRANTLCLIVLTAVMFARIDVLPKWVLAPGWIMATIFSGVFWCVERAFINLLNRI